MKKILFVGINWFELAYIVRKVNNGATDKPFEFLTADTVTEVVTQCSGNLDMLMIVLFGELMPSANCPKDERMPSTAKLISPIRKMLGSEVVIIAALDDREFNQILLEGGCNTIISREELPGYLKGM